MAALLSGAAPPPSAPEPIPDLAELRRQTARYAPVELNPDLSRLPEGERRALAKMVEAAYVLDAIYLRQVWAGNESLLLQLAQDPTPLGRERLRAFVLNKGPWSRLDGDAPFIPGVPAKPEGANVYPADAAKAELERWTQSLSAPERAKATGFFTAIRRSPTGALTSVPYAVEYQGELQRAAGLLREAAVLTAQPTLKRYLAGRADAFLSNDYYASDVAWMELDASIEPVFGPYEVYEDRWFNAKAFFEAYVTLRDDAETQKLERFGAELQDIEDHLPINPKYRNPKLGALAPIRVVNSLFGAGDANHGVQTAAFNLPNDERVTREKGAKRVMLKNVQEAKFERVLRPVAARILSKADGAQVSFSAFFTFILMHELMHGLGPHDLQVSGKTGTAREALQETYSAVEEAKADISGLFALHHLVDKGVVDRSLERAFHVTYVAGAFRTLMFGLTEAHARGQALQLGALIDAGAVAVRPDGTFAVNSPKMREAAATLTRELMTLKAEGDLAQARERLARAAQLRPEVQRALHRLRGLPTDILPRFTAAESLRAP